MKEKIIKYIPFIIIIVVCIALLSNSFYTVNPGETAIRMRFGSIIDSQKDSGLYGKMPFVDKIIHINNRIRSLEIESNSCLSKDLQSVQARFVVNFKIDNAIELYKTIGTDFEKVIIEPFALESIKSGLAKYTAEHLVQFRDETRDFIAKDLKDKLAPFNITVVEVNFVLAVFSSEFMHAVERKQIADQDARTAKNLTEQIKEEALQIKTRADAESYALKVKKENLTKELIELKKIEKWNGVLPHLVNGSATMFNI